MKLVNLVGLLHSFLKPSCIEIHIFIGSKHVQPILYGCNQLCSKRLDAGFYSSDIMIIW